MTRIDKVLETMVRIDGPIEWLYEETSRERSRLEQERKDFERWSADNGSETLEGRSLQWEAWLARAKGDFE